MLVISTLEMTTIISSRKTPPFKFLRVLVRLAPNSSLVRGDGEPPQKSGSLDLLRMNRCLAIGSRSNEILSASRVITELLLKALSSNKNHPGKEAR